MLEGTLNVVRPLYFSLLLVSTTHPPDPTASKEIWSNDSLTSDTSIAISTVRIIMRSWETNWAVGVSDISPIEEASMLNLAGDGSSDAGGARVASRDIIGAGYRDFSSSISTIVESCISLLDLTVL